MSLCFQIDDTPIEGLKIIHRNRLGDNRGHLERLFCAEEIAVAGWHKPIAQINHTYTMQRGTVRGMHFQHPPHAEMKLVMCLQGEVWDVAIDLRANSSTRLQWHAQNLSRENGLALLIPEGFAHGFQTLTDDVEMLYCHSVPYQSAAEAGLHPEDKTIGIRWPLPISKMSARDAGHAPLNAVLEESKP